MSIIAMFLLCSTFADGEGAEDFPKYSSVELPLRLADEFPQQQDLENVPVEKPNRKQNRRDDDDSMLIDVAARLRFSIPFGAANRNYSNNYYYGYYYVSSYTSWADVFNPGWGFEVEADFFFGKNGPGSRRTPGYNYGLCLILQTDQYYGRTVDGDVAIQLKMDDMTATALMIGGRYIQTLSTDFYYGGMFALGAVHYTEVDGVFSGPLVPVPTRDKILRDTYTFASSFRMDGGYRIGSIGISLGMALRIMAPPQEGTHMSMDSGAFWTFDINLGVDIGF
jgi:hypothetical protein